MLEHYVAVLISEALIPCWWNYLTEKLHSSLWGTCYFRYLKAHYACSLMWGFCGSHSDLPIFLKYSIVTKKQLNRHLIKSQEHRKVEFRFWSLVFCNELLFQEELCFFGNLFKFWVHQEEMDLGEKWISDVYLP